MSWPTRSAAAAPASTAAFTAAVSPRNLTVTSPASAFSVPNNRTWAALSPASAASMAPTRPRVSMSLSASPASSWSGVLTRRSLRDDHFELRVWARDHVHRHQLAHSLGGGGAGVRRCLHRADVPADHDGHITATDFFLADQ